MRILIADDKPEIVKLISAYLTKRGHAVQTAMDGQQAVELLEKNEYDVAFFDHNMPEVTGLELVKFVKSKGFKTKTVMLTGYPSMKDFLARSVGADAYLSKPFQLEDIDKTLQDLFGSST
jgi:CheY-like chemotaxis protein